MKKNQVISVRVNETLEKQINLIKQKFNIDFEGNTDFFNFLITQVMEGPETEIKEVEKIVEVEKSMPENSFLMQFSAKDYNDIVNIVDICKLQNYLHSVEQLFSVLLQTCQKRGDFIITQADYDMLIQSRLIKSRSGNE